MDIKDSIDKKGGGRKPGLAARLLRRLLAGLAVLALAPFVIAVFYRAVDPPVTSLMLVRKMQGFPAVRQWQPLEKISPNLVRAVMASEDARFCSHHGVDWQEMSGLIGKLFKAGGTRVRGGSTLTMQLAKNLFLWPGRSYVRKAYEIALAYWIELVWTKRRIMEVYLNIVEWAPGIYGAEAASRHHFGRPANRLSAGQASLLAASLPNPLVRNAARPGYRTGRAARQIRRRMKQMQTRLECVLFNNGQG